jgi:hypothetical protein
MCREHTAIREYESGRGESRPVDAQFRLRQALKAAALLLLSVLLALLAHGYVWELGVQNQPLQIPLIQRLADPQLFPGDPLVEELGKNRSVFFHAVAAAKQRVSIETQFLILHVITTMAAAAAMWALARLLGASRTAAHLAALFLLVSPIIRPTEIGHDTLLTAWVTPTTVSFPILLLSLHRLFAGRHGQAGVIAGLAAQLNLLAAGLFMIVAFPAALSESRPAGKRRRALAAAPAAMRLAGGFGLAAAWPSILGIPDRSLVLDDRGLDLIDLLRRYYPYHFFLSSHPPGHFLHLAMLSAVAVVGFRAIPRSAPVHRALQVLLGVGAALAIGSFFADVFPVAAITQLHLLRADRWFLVILFAVAGIVAARAAGPPNHHGWTEGWTVGIGGERNVQETWSLTAGLALAAGLARGAFPLIAWAAMILILQPGREGRPLHRVRIATVAAAAPLALTRLWEPRFRMSSALLAVLLVLALTARQSLVHRLRFQHRALLAVVAVAVLELAISNGTFGSQGANLFRRSFHPDWRDVQEWAAAATPRTARFLTPPDYTGFRVYALRSTVVEWKDGAAMLWDPPYGPVWWERYSAAKAAFTSGRAADLLSTAWRYEAGWIVVPAAQAPPEMTPVYQNSGFKVFAAGEMGGAGEAARSQ